MQPTKENVGWKWRQFWSKHKGWGSYFSNFVRVQATKSSEKTKLTRSRSNWLCTQRGFTDKGPYFNLLHRVSGHLSQLKGGAIISQIMTNTLKGCAKQSLLGEIKKLGWFSWYKSHKTNTHPHSYVEYLRKCPNMYECEGRGGYTSRWSSGFSFFSSGGCSSIVPLIRPISALGGGALQLGRAGGAVIGSSSAWTGQGVGWGLKNSIVFFPRTSADDLWPAWFSWPSSQAHQVTKCVTRANVRTKGSGWNPSHCNNNLCESKEPRITPSRTTEQLQILS